MTCQCPATMCPLVARDGSPWTGGKSSPCPEKGLVDDEDRTGDALADGCPWWDMGCGGNGMQFLVHEAEEAGGKAAVIGPNRPRRREIGAPRTFECPKESVCSWQKQALIAGYETCAPRTALAKGIDPRVVLF